MPLLFSLQISHVPVWEIQGCRIRYTWVPLSSIDSTHIPIDAEELIPVRLCVSICST